MTRKSKPRRACPSCKHYKYVGNGKGRRPIKDLRRLQDAIGLRRKDSVREEEG